MSEMFPDYPGESTGGYNVDGSPWYREYKLAKQGFGVAYYDFFETAEQRIHYDNALVNDPSVPFSMGIKVGMSKADFANAFDLSSESVKLPSTVTLTSGDDRAIFIFEDDILKSVTLKYAMFDLPPTLWSISTSWTTIDENEGEGQIERFQQCNPSIYELTTTEDGSFEGGSLTITEPTDVQVYEINWIRRYPKGIMVNVKTGETGTYSYEVVMKDEDWEAAEWQGHLCVDTDEAAMLMKFPCEEEDGE